MSKYEVWINYGWNCQEVDAVSEADAKQQFVDMVKDGLSTLCVTAALIDDEETEGGNS